MSRFKEGDAVWVVAGGKRWEAATVVQPSHPDVRDPNALPLDEVVRVGYATPQGERYREVEIVDVMKRTEDAPQATGPVHVVKIESTRRTVRTPENDGGLYSEESEDNEITLVTAAGHRIELAPWVVDALRMELSR